MGRESWIVHDKRNERPDIHLSTSCFVGLSRIVLTNCGTSLSVSSTSKLTYGKSPKEGVIDITVMTAFNTLTLAAFSCSFACVLKLLYSWSI